jgi:hypothetical protein
MVTTMTSLQMTFATLLIWPMLAQIGWTFFLYAWLTWARQQAVKSGKIDYSGFLLGRDEPLEVARITRNLANQFELPVVFYTVVVLLVALHAVGTIDLVVAWVFFAGRIVHSLVQTLTNDVILRGRVFLISFLAAAVLVAHLAALALKGVGTSA